MPPWSGHLTWDTQTVLLVIGVLALILIVGCVLYILYDEPPERKADKRKSPTLPYAPPPPPHLTLGPRFAEIEAWKREQEGEKPFLPGVVRLGETSEAPGRSGAREVTPASPADEAAWLNDGARRPETQVEPPDRAASPGTPDQPASPEAGREGEKESEVAQEGMADQEETAADEAWEPAFSSLRPVHLTWLEEETLTADQREVSEVLSEEQAGEASGETAEEARSSLHPVQLHWGLDNPEDEPLFEQETPGHQTARVQPSVRQESLTALQDALPHDLESAASREATAEGLPHAQSGEAAGTMPIAVQAFGRAQLLVFGKPIKNRANRHLELVLYLAHQAAMSGEEREYVDRLIISDELWPEEGNETSRQLERLRNCKSELVGDVERAGLTLEQCPWLETGPENALRLNSAVPNDIALFAALVEQIAEARAQAERGAQDLQVAQMDAWHSHLKHLYQGGVAQQFGSKPWLDKARRHYQAQFFQASFDLARLLARMGAIRQAIDLGTETVLAAMPRGEGMMGLLVEWVQQQEPMERETWASRFADEYEHRYGRTLARAHKKMEALRHSVLPTR